MAYNTSRSSWVPQSHQTQLTKEQFDNLLEAEAQLFTAADKLFEEYRALWVSILGEKLEGSVWDGTGVVAPYSGLYPKTIDKESIEYGADEYWSFGGHEHHSFSLPSRYLYEDWKPETRANFEAILARYEDQLEARRKAAKAAEIQKLKELKEKYPEAN